MRKIMGYASALIAVGLLILILINIAFAGYYCQSILKEGLIHWLGQIAIFFSIIAAWAFWEI